MHGLFHSLARRQTRYNVVELPNKSIHSISSVPVKLCNPSNSSPHIIMSAPMECWICMLRSGVRRAFEFGSYGFANMTPCSVTFDSLTLGGKECDNEFSKSV